MKYSTIDYDFLVQDALRGVVATVLQMVAEEGLPDGHHFYIAFRTDHPEVVVPNHLRARYPEEITIVLQHQFWNLQIFEDRFEVSLSFNKRPETLVVPFEALSGFMDPSVQFGLQLKPAGVPDTETADGQPGEGESPFTPAVEEDDEAGAETPETAEEPRTGTDGDNVVPLDIFRKNSKS